MSEGGVSRSRGKSTPIDIDAVATFPPPLGTKGGHETKELAGRVLQLVESMKRSRCKQRRAIRRLPSKITDFHGAPLALTRLFGDRQTVAEEGEFQALRRIMLR